MSKENQAETQDMTGEETQGHNSMLLILLPKLLH